MERIGGIEYVVNTLRAAIQNTEVEAILLIDEKRFHWSQLWSYLQKLRKISYFLLSVLPFVIHFVNSQICFLTRNNARSGKYN